jgi:hypothetical protein
MANPLSTLGEVDQWLSSLSAGTEVELSAAMFEAGPVRAVFEMLPGPIALTNTAVQPVEHLLEGTAEVLGEADTAVKLAFSEPTEPPGPLACDLNLTPLKLTWKPLEALDLSFGEFSGRLAADPALKIVSLDLDATVAAGEKLRLPVEISVPSFDGDWVVRGSFEPGIAPDVDGLVALAGGGEEAKTLAAKIAHQIGDFKLTGVEAAFDPSSGSCSLIGLSVAYSEPWKFFDEHFELEEIDFACTVREPFGKSPVPEAKLSAKVKIGGTPFDVGGSYPDMVVSAQLAPEGALDVNTVFEFLHVSHPEGFPQIEISLLAFVFYIETRAFEFQVGIEKSFEVLSGVRLDSFLFALRATHDPSKGFEAAGSIYCHITIGETPVALGGTYSESGIALEGATQHLEIGEIVKHLAEAFGIKSVPAPIEKLELETAHAGFDTAAGTFQFVCEGTTEVAGTKVEFVPKIELSYDKVKEKYGVHCDGRLTLAPAGGDRLEFEVEFSETDTDEYFTATYKDLDGGGLGLGTLAAALGFDPPDLPEALQLTLEEVTLLYDFSKGKEALAIGAKTAHGAAALVGLPSGEGKPWRFFFLFEASGGFSLSNLPLVGKELSEVEELAISELQGIVASEAAEKATAEAVNPVIARLETTLDSSFPRLPEGGSGRLTIAGLLQAGSEKTPLDVALGGSSAAPASAAAAATGEEPGSTTWVDIQKSFGPVSIQRIGAMYQSKGETLWFELDADLAFGPLTLGLEGLGVGSPLKTFSPSFDLRGLAVAYDAPPLEIAGGLVNLAPPGAHYVEFEGGVVVGTPEFKLQAFGYYGDRPGFASMFLFGDLDYPIGGPPAFFVTGLALGFGYNSALRTPTIDEVGEFPLVATLPGSTTAEREVFGSKNPTPLDVLEYMRKGSSPWVEPKAGSLWFAAGATFTSFELISGQALVLVEIGEELTIVLVGTASTQFPQLDPQEPGPVYARVELDILVRLAPGEGVFSAQAQLAKSSFVLDQACVLTGGFAFFVWFGDNPHAGDFVLTLGGYNPGFAPPSHYPTVPEVGFNWSVDDSITLSGGAYLAITPSVLMAGARLDATYHSGNLKAWFDAHADVLIRWKPFWVEAGVGITVGASYTIDVLGLSWTPSVELGCELEVWGPPTGGKVHVDWYVIGFTIHFGSDGDEPEPLKEWSQVEALLPNAAHPGSKEINVLSLKPSAGLVPPPGGTPSGAGEPAAGPWPVRGSQFAFEATTPVPVTTGTVGSQPLSGGDSFDVHPLGKAGVSSTYALTVAPAGEPSTDRSGAFEAEELSRDLPASLWGAPPESGGKPQVPAPGEQLVPKQLIGASLQVKPPALGASAGPIEVAKSLANRDLELPDAQLPLSGEATPSGDVPAGGGAGTVAKIADEAAGIASGTVGESRKKTYEALAGAGLAPSGCDDPMTEFRKAAGCAFAAEPMLVP